MSPENQRSAPSPGAALKSRLRAELVSKSYELGETTLHALHQVSLTIEDGEFVAIAGSSGSGKTTLLNLFGCLDSVTSGRILIDGHEVGRMNSATLSRFRAQKIGFIFQTFNLLSVLSVEENIEYPLLLLDLPKKERADRVRQALVDVKLEKHGKHRPSQLSGGQRQRVAIARAMVKRPSIILADEPTANLDKSTASGILDLMEEFNRNSGVTFVFASHDPLLLSRARRTVNLSDGRIKG